MWLGCTRYTARLARLPDCCNVDPQAAHKCCPEWLHVRRHGKLDSWVDGAVQAGVYHCLGHCICIAITERQCQHMAIDEAATHLACYPVIVGQLQTGKSMADNAEALTQRVTCYMCDTNCGRAGELVGESVGYGWVGDCHLSGREREGGERAH